MPIPSFFCITEAVSILPHKAK